MSELVITPNLERKTARFRGTAAAGEHVAVRVVGTSSLVVPSLRLRADLFGTTLAVFPVESSDTWEVDGDDLVCTLNLNTVPALKAFRRVVEMEVLFILDDPAGHRFHFADVCGVRGWPQEARDTPADLDGYHDFVEHAGAQLSALEGGVSQNKSAISMEVVARKAADAEIVKGVSSLSDKVSGKQDTLTADQLEAVNSGINAEKVAKIARVEAGLAGKVSKAAFEVFGGIADPSASLSSLKSAVTLILTALKGLKS